MDTATTSTAADVSGSRIRVANSPWHHEPVVNAKGICRQNPYSELLSGVTPREAEITVSELLSQQEAISTPQGRKLWLYQVPNSKVMVKTARLKHLCSLRFTIR